MVRKGNKGLFENLSRKDLQNMCKLYGLPANKSHSQLENSLFAFFQEGINGSVCDLKKESLSKCKGSGGSQGNSQTKSSADKCLSLSKGNAVELRPESSSRGMDDGRCLAEDNVASPIQISAKPPSSSFQFYVRSDDGLNLYVDLKSTPSDWTREFQREIHITENVQHSKSWSLHDDLASLKDIENEIRSSCENVVYEEIGDGNLGSQSSLYSEVEKNDQPELSIPEMSLDPLPVQTHSLSVDASEKSKENLDSDAIDLLDESKSIDDTVVNSISDQALSHVILDHATVNLNQCQSRIVEGDSSLLNPAMVYPGWSASSFEMSSEAGSCNKDASGLNCEDGGPVGDFDTKDNKESEKTGLTNSDELNQLPVSAEERERSNTLNEKESSECSQFSKPSDKTFFDSDNLDSRGGHQKKRKHVDVEHQSDYSQPNVKILRSMKPKKDIPRRSSRLMSK